MHPPQKKFRPPITSPPACENQAQRDGCGRVRRSGRSRGSGGPGAGKTWRGRRASADMAGNTWRPEGLQTGTDEVLHALSLRNTERGTHQAFPANCSGARPAGLPDAWSFPISTAARRPAPCLPRSRPAASSAPPRRTRPHPSLWAVPPQPPKKQYMRQTGQES